MPRKSELLLVSDFHPLCQSGRPSVGKWPCGSGRTASVPYGRAHGVACTMPHGADAPAYVWPCPPVPMSGSTQSKTYFPNRD